MVLPFRLDWIRVLLRPINFYDSRVPRNEALPTPPGPEGSNGRNNLRVPRGSLAITLFPLCPMKS
jgi:hypothetical protein